jgi:C-terminal processing protease CtpA/Prc
MSTLTEQQRTQILDKIAAIVERRLYDSTLKNLWRILVRKRYQDILLSPDDETFEQRVNDLLQQLGVSHIGFFHEAKPRAGAKLAIAATFYAYCGNGRPQWVFQDVHPGGAAHQVGVQPGDFLPQVADCPVMPPTLPTFALGTDVPMEIETRAGRRVRAQIQVPQSKTKQRPLVELKPVSWTKLDEETGYLKVAMFPGVIGVDLARELDQAIKGLACRRLVIDLRGNSGGGIGSLRLMSYLTPNRVEVGYSISRQLLAQDNFDPATLPCFQRIPRSKGELYFRLPLMTWRARKRSVLVATEGLGVQPFQGRVALLINEHSVSSSEMVAAFAAENKLATLVGTKTPGRLTGASSFPVGHGYRVALPVSAYRTCTRDARPSHTESRRRAAGARLCHHPAFAANLP